jgi:hypothetical protein
MRTDDRNLTTDFGKRPQTLIPWCSPSAVISGAPRQKVIQSPDRSNAAAAR